MPLPFGQSELLQAFAATNAVFQPLQLITAGLRVFAGMLLLCRQAWIDRPIAAVFCMLWSVMESGYLVMYCPTAGYWRVS